MRVLFLFVGEHHHVFHSLPLAAELAASQPDFEVHVAVADAGYRSCLQTVIEAYPGFAPVIHELPMPAALRSATRLMGGNARLLRLLAALSWLRGFDAIVVPERTTTILRHLLRRDTQLIFTPHGAGDRAVVVDPRDRHFDFVLVAGEKSERRLFSAGVIRRGHYAVNGYVKLDLMHRLARTRSPLFGNDRHTVLYAPHFRASLSSWDRFGCAIVEQFRRQDAYNLIVAPHIRLFHAASVARKAAVLALAEEGKIIVDLDSDRLVDMTYTAAADVYLGDVSSQVYEFISRPRPCVFLNAHGVAWQQDPNYRFWKLGDVVDTLPALLPAIDASFARHAGYTAEQRAALADSVGGDPLGAARRGADAIAGFLRVGTAPARVLLREPIARL
jgi:hypothetical protein